MSPNTPPTNRDVPSGPSGQRYAVATVLTLTACLLYLDRYAVNILRPSIRADLNMTQVQFSWFESLFFWSYALCQIPAGWLSDRLGPRRVLTIYIVGWSIVTGLMGVVSTVWGMLLLRFLCGIAQAGAYPVCSGLIRVWFPVKQRGFVSSIVALGGRFGAVLAPVLTAALLSRLGMGWQSVLVSYGLTGIAVAIACYAVCRDKPEHPLPLPAIPAQPSMEVATTSNDSAVLAPFPWSAALRSLSLWGNSMQQFFTNIGWLFVVSQLPQYLADIHNIGIEKRAAMTAVPTIAGIVGMFCGGWLTDVVTRHLGLKWSRRLPVMITRFGAAAGFLLCLLPGILNPSAPPSPWLPWMVIAALSFATFCSDLGIPAVWAYAQDVGGPYTASIMGWANMFGNLGAAVAPNIYTGVLGETPGVKEWNMLFFICGMMFVLAGICSLALDSTKAIRAGENRG